MQQLTAEDIIKSIKKVALDRGYEVIEDNLNIIVKGLMKNYEKHGGYYCPCRLVKDDDEWKKKITCPCVFLDDEIAEKGECHCRLYRKSPNHE
jgi:ferredoxin-thioredoxin reductase catalytic subunit